MEQVLTNHYNKMRFLTIEKYFEICSLLPARGAVFTSMEIIALVRENKTLKFVSDRL